MLHPPGLKSQGSPPDEPIYKDLGDTMAAESGYTSQKSWELYDTTGTTEDSGIVSWTVICTRPNGKVAGSEQIVIDRRTAQAVTDLQERRETAPLDDARRGRLCAPSGSLVMRLGYRSPMTVL